MNLNIDPTFSISYCNIVEDILDALGEDILFSYSHVSSNLYDIIEGMEFDSKYLYPKALDELDYSDKDYSSKIDAAFKNIPKVIFDSNKIAEIMDEWFDENYNSDEYVTKDVTKIFHGLVNALYMNESEFINVRFTPQVTAYNGRIKGESPSQFINNYTPVKCRSCVKLEVCKLVEQGFTDICKYKQ